MPDFRPKLRPNKFGRKHLGMQFLSLANHRTTPPHHYQSTPRSRRARASWLGVNQVFAGAPDQDRSAVRSACPVNFCAEGRDSRNFRLSIAEPEVSPELGPPTWIPHGGTRVTVWTEPLC